MQTMFLYTDVNLTRVLHIFDTIPLVPLNNNAMVFLFESYAPIWTLHSYAKASHRIIAFLLSEASRKDTQNTFGRNWHLIKIQKLKRFKICILDSIANMLTSCIGNSVQVRNIHSVALSEK